MSIFSVLIWLITGMGMFWPVWVLSAFILTIFVESLQICSFSCVRRWFNFLTPEWEDNEVNRCMNVNCYVTCNPSYTSTNTNTNVSAQTQTTATVAAAATTPETKPATAPTSQQTV